MKLVPEKLMSKLLEHATAEEVAKAVATLIKIHSEAVKYKRPGHIPNYDLDLKMSLICT